jgi:septum formation protein
VSFRRLSAEEIDGYLRSGEWAGRAGGYAVQGLGARLVARVDGDYLNVVGLPATLLLDALAAHVPKLLQIHG